MSGQKYYGKYRATVANNIDPMMQGRIQAMVPDVLGTSISSWALPCVPFAGTQSGIYVLPSVGAGVWIEFEQGEIDHPIWVGGWWGSASEVPSVTSMAIPGVPPVVIQTSGGHRIWLNDGATGIMLETPGGAAVMISDTVISISNGQGASITLSGPTVSINGAALTIT